jgi:hypothetical protein
MTTKITFQGIHTDGGLIAPNTPEWYQWLESAKSFRFEINHETWIDERVPKIETLTFSGVRVSGYWQAHKKVSGLLRREHLGKSPDYAKFKEVAILSCSDAYWHQKRRSPKSVSTESHKSSNHETVSESSSPSGDEIAKLKARIAELENQEEELLNLQEENMRLQDESAKLKQKFEGLPEREREMREEINRLMKLELENSSLKNWNQELRQALEANPSPDKLIEEYETDYETIKGTLPKPPKDVTRNWVEFWRFKSWLSRRLER